MNDQRTRNGDRRGQRVLAAAELFTVLVACGAIGCATPAGGNDAGSVDTSATDPAANTSDGSDSQPEDTSAGSGSSGDTHTSVVATDENTSSDQPSNTGSAGDTSSADTASTDTGSGTSDDPGTCAVAAPLTGAGVVTLGEAGGRWTLYRDGAPYYIKGVGGQTNLARAAAAGANSTRTWGAENASAVLNDAAQLGMTVLLGIWLSHNAGDYTNDGYKDGIRAQLQGLLDNYRDHPALLMWALGNEINLGADTQAAWEFVNELAEMIQAQDQGHPTVTVIAGANTGVMNHVRQWASAIEVIGVNSYGGVMDTGANVDASDFRGPYMVTEWGPDGHWEVAATDWGRPIEQTSASKAASYGARYDYILAQTQRCLGAYIFLWGQKQERTPSWYGLFAETRPALGLNGESYPAVDVMQQGWCGRPPANRAPVVTAMTMGGQAAAASVRLTNGQVVTVAVTAADPEGDGLTYLWEVLKEPSALGEGGSYEPRPDAVNGVIIGAGPSVRLTAPAGGEYRVFVYVLDGKGHVGSANVPFLVP